MNVPKSRRTEHREAACRALRLHLLGSPHGLSDDLLRTEPAATEGEWLQAVHLSNHNAPYPPLVPHDWQPYPGVND